MIDLFLKYLLIGDLRPLIFQVINKMYVSVVVIMLNFGVVCVLSGILCIIVIFFNFHSLSTMLIPLFTLKYNLLYLFRFGFLGINFLVCLCCEKFYFFLKLWQIVLLGILVYIGEGSWDLHSTLFSSSMFPLAKTALSHVKLKA